MTNIFIPAKINVGYQNRGDTYTKRLAYVIYYDQKGKLRKETSWNSWRNHSLGNNEFDNAPTEGFVLNKHAGGYSTGWNHRQSYARVYDPRNFEIEISVDNLLYILDNADCMRGKGLQGKFVYGWKGTELVLLPEASPEYSTQMEFTDMVSNPESLKGKDLVLGGVYRTAKNEDYVYLGRFDLYETTHNRGKHYFFEKLDKKYSYDSLQLKSISNRFVKTITTVPVEDYAARMDRLERSTMYSPYDPSRDVYEKVTIDNILKVGTLYFNLNGIRLCTSIDKEWNYETQTYNEEKVSLRDFRRVNPEFNNAYYYDAWKDAFLKEINKEYRDYQGYDNKLWEPKELLEKFNFECKRVFCKNGKEING